MTGQKAKTVRVIYSCGQRNSNVPICLVRKRRVMSCRCQLAQLVKKIHSSSSIALRGRGQIPIAAWAILEKRGVSLSNISEEIAVKATGLESTRQLAQGRLGDPGIMSELVPTVVSRGS